MNILAHPETFLSIKENQVLRRFRHLRMDTYTIAKSMQLVGGEPEAVRMLASAREKERAAG
jgi:hypothetical protein